MTPPRHVTLTLTRREANLLGAIIEWAEDDTGDRGITRVARSIQRKVLAALEGY